MTTYYVSNNGSDTAAGTSTSSAFASLARAAQAMVANSSADTAYVMDGTAVPASAAVPASRDGRLEPTA